MPKGSLRAFAAVALAFGLGVAAAAPTRCAPATTSYIRGRVVDGKGKPVAIAQVLLLSIATKTVFSGAASGRDGSFSFYGMEPGRYGIMAQKTPACALSRAIVIRPGKTYSVLVRMPASARCYGPTHFSP